nr:hypothetical protein [Tanacetum cinerariifolium]
MQLVYDVLRICPFFKAFLGHATHLSEVHGQSFDEPPFEEDILAFIHFLGHSAAIKTLTYGNINKLYQPWRSFASIINKCLTGKSSGYDSLRLSQAQTFWGLYHKRNVDYAYLMWEDFVYQVEHKNHKKSNEMYYPRFTKAIIHYFMSKDSSIPRRNKVHWHYVKDDHIFSTIKLVSRHQNTQQFDEGTGSIPGVPDAPTDKSKEELSWNSTDDEGADDEGNDDDDDEEDEGDDGQEGNGDDDEDDDGEEGDDDDADQEVVRDDDKDDEQEERHVEEEEEDEHYRDININQGRGLQASLEVEDSHVTLTLVKLDGMESIFGTTSQLDVQTPTSVASLPMSAPTMTPSTIATITTTSQAPILPTTVSSNIIQN